MTTRKLPSPIAICNGKYGPAMDPWDRINALQTIERDV